MYAFYKMQFISVTTDSTYVYHRLMFNLVLAPCLSCNYYDMCAGHVVLPHNCRRRKLFAVP